MQSFRRAVPQRRVVKLGATTRTMATGTSFGALLPPRRLPLIALVLYAVFAAVTAHARGDKERFDGHQVVRIIPRTRSEVDILRHFESSLFSELDFWKPAAAPKRPVDVRVPPEVTEAFTEALNQKNLTHSIIIDNVQRLIESERSRHRPRRSAARRDLLTSYGSHREINQWLEDAAARCGARCAVLPIGSSHEGRAMKVIRISAGGLTPYMKPSIWIDATMHAREWITSAIAINIVHKLISSYATDSCTRLLTHEFVWYVLPVANPDGYEHSRTRNRMWRKNRTPPPRTQPSSRHDVPWWAAHMRGFESSFVCNGTDQNRNFGFNWGGVGASNNPCSDTFSGPRAFSEPETRNIRDFVMGLRGQLKVYLTLHSYGQYWLYPWAYERRLPPDAEDLNAVANAAVAAISRASGRRTHYVVGPAAKTLYAASGGSDDWAKGTVGSKYAYTVELPPSDTDAAATNGFVVPESDIQRIARETWPGIQQMARAVLQRECACPRGSDQLRSLAEACAASAP